MPTRAKMIHYLRMETLENHTISGGRKPIEPKYESNPSTVGISKQQFTENASNADRRFGLLVSTAPSMKSQIWLGRW